MTIKEIYDLLKEMKEKLYDKGFYEISEENYLLLKDIDCYLSNYKPKLEEFSDFMNSKKLNKFLLINLNVLTVHNFRNFTK